MFFLISFSVHSGVIWLKCYLEFFSVKIKGAIALHAKLCLIYLVTAVCAAVIVAKSNEWYFVVSKSNTILLLVLTKEDTNLSSNICWLFFYHLYSNSLLPEYECYIRIRINYIPGFFIGFACVLTLLRGTFMEIWLQDQGVRIVTWISVG